MRTPPRPCIQGRGVGGEGREYSEKITPLTPTPLPLSTGGEGLMRTPPRPCIQGRGVGGEGREYSEKITPSPQPLSP